MKNDTYMTRETLLRRLKKADNDFDWQEFVGFYERFIYGIIINEKVPENDRDDVSQMVMLKLYHALPKFDYDRNQGQFRSWLYKVTQNTARKFLRDGRKAANLASLDELEFLLSGTSPEVEAKVKKEWEKHLTALAMNNIREKVSEKAMEAFLSNFTEESVASVCERLEITDNTLYVYRMRVRNALMAEVRNLDDMLL